MHFSGPDGSEQVSAISGAQRGCFSDRRRKLKVQVVSLKRKIKLELLKKKASINVYDRSRVISDSPDGHEMELRTGRLLQLTLV